MLPFLPFPSDRQGRVSSYKRCFLALGISSIESHKSWTRFSKCASMHLPLGYSIPTALLASLFIYWSSCRVWRTWSSSCGNNYISFSLSPSNVQSNTLGKVRLVSERERGGVEGGGGVPLPIHQWEGEDEILFKQSNCLRNPGDLGKEHDHSDEERKQKRGRKEWRNWASN